MKMGRMTRVVLTLLVVFVMRGPVWADELNVPYEYATIQAAIDEANDGDAVIVSEGPYNENISFNGKNIIVTTLVPCYPGVEDGPIIQGTGTGPVVTFAGSEDANCGLFGFVITGGNTSGNGGGICGNGTAAAIAYCFIRNNHADGSGGGLSDCDGEIVYCIIRDNKATDGGGLSNCDGSVVNCLITNNSSDGDGGGMVCSGNNTVINCTIGGNSAYFKGGGIFCAAPSVLTMVNSIVWGNSAEFGPQIYNFGGSVAITYSDVQGGHAGEGNIDSDPLFVAPGSDNYHLEPFSPCIDVGDNNGVPPSANWDLDGNPRIVNCRVDMGTYEHQGAIYVDDDAPGDPGPGDPDVSDPLENGSQAHPFDAIQEAIDAAESTDTVMVLDGTYTGAGNKNLDFKNKAITVRSTDPKDPCVVAATVIDCQNSGRGFYFHSGEDANSILSGFTITRGSASEGAGICCSGSSPAIENCRIIGNHTFGLDAYGGGIHCTSGSSPRVVICTIKNNTAEGVDAADPEDLWGYAFGGAISCTDLSHATIEDCMIADNNVLGGDVCPDAYAQLGGYAYGGGIYCSYDSHPTIERCIVSGNAAVGGIGMGGYSPWPTGGGPAFGGGIFGNAIINSSLITGNNVTGGIGGGLGGIGGGASGGGMYCDLPSEINTCTIADNTSVGGEGSEAPGGSAGGGVYAEDYVTLALTNCILWANDAETGSQIYGDCVLSYCDVEGGYPGEGNINADPLFVEADANDYHLLVGSPCINAGDPNYTGQADDTDLDGNPRIVMGRVDMGAYESHLVYVDDDAPDDPGPGDPDVSDPLENGSQAHPFDAIQEAIDAAESAGTVMVLEGTYTGTGNRDLDFFGKAITVKSSCGPENCAINCEGTESDPHRAFYFHGGEGANSVVDGFTITRGYISDFGGAIKCDNSSPTIANCVLLGNTAPGGGAGGAIGCINSHATIMNCAITGNSAEGSGGFVFNGSGGAICNLGSNPTINNCTIGENQASNRGGAIFNLESSPTIHNCILWGDGPEEIFVSDGTPVVSYCDVQGSWEGPGNINADPLFVDADANDYHLLAGSLCINAGDPNYTGQPGETDLDGNQRIVAGRVDMGAYEFQGVVYVDDDAPGDPGPGDANVSDPMENGSQAHPFDSIQEGIDVASDSGWVAVYPGIYEEGIDFVGKAITVAGTAGAAIIQAPGNYAVWFSHGEDANSVFKNFVVRNSYGGLLFVSSSPTVSQVTVVDCNNGAIAAEGAQPDISNSIFWNNADDDLYQCEARYSCIGRGGEGLGNISIGPLFVDAANGDYHLKSEGWRWAGSGWTWDEATSRCMDAGNPGTPLGNEPESVPRDPNNDYGINLRINMGAYGGTSQASMAPHGWALLADLNNDGIVNWPDFGWQAKDWQKTADEQPGDANRDGVVNMMDLALLAEEWMQVADWVEFVNFAEYWPFAVGNRWDSESMPDAGFRLEITNRFFVNNFEIWEFTNWYMTISGSYQVIAYYVYVNGGLYATENPSDLDSLPEVSGDLELQYPEQIPVGAPVYIPHLGTVTTRRGTLSSVLEGTRLTVGDFPLGDRDDVLAFIGQNWPNVTVFARDLGPMLLYGFFIVEAIVTE